MTVPTVWPAIVFIIVMLVIGGLNVFTSVLLMTRSGPNDQAGILLTYMHHPAFSGLNFRYGLTIAIVLTVLMFIASIVQLKVLNRDDGRAGA